MKTVRFSQVVKKAGKPSTHLQLVPARRDRALKRAAAEDRVMTVSQATVGHSADYGVVGLDTKLRGQVLIFPRSLAKFSGKHVVGIKYDMLEQPAISASALAPITKAKEKAKTTRKKASSRKTTNVEALLRAAAAATEKTPEEDSRPKPNRKRQRQKSSERRPPKSSTHLHTGIRDALQSLEDGESVKAYKILKGLLEEAE